MVGIFGEEGQQMRATAAVDKLSQVVVVVMTMTVVGRRGSLPIQYRRSGQVKRSARRLQTLGKHYVFSAWWQPKERSE